MPKIADLLPQTQLLNDLPVAPGQIGDARVNTDADGALVAGEQLPEQLQSDLKQQLQSRLPLTGQLLKHTLQSFDKTAAQNQPKNEPQNHSSNSQNQHQTLDARASANANLNAREAEVNVKAEVNAAPNSNANGNANANGATNSGANAAVGVKAENAANNQTAQTRVNTNGQTAQTLIGANANLNQRDQVLNNPGARAAFVALAANSANSFLRSLQMPSRREIAEFKAILGEKAADILRGIGIDPEELEQESERGEINLPNNRKRKEDQSDDELRDAAQIFDGTNEAAEDDALFASALNIAGEAAGESRILNGDGLLLEFANYGTEKVDLSLDSLAQNLLQNGTKAGLETLLDHARTNFSDATIDVLAQVADKLPNGNDKKDFVVGVLTMSVMTRETLERLDTIATGASLGLSDDALAALQKAQNSLRDHLTTLDLIGATGDAKNAPVSINGETYRFLPEVTEAVNSLRDARSRVLAETAGASGIESASRFAVETDALFNIVKNVEKMLAI